MTARRGWSMIETVGMTAVNPLPVVRVEASPELLEEFIRVTICECGEDRVYEEREEAFVCPKCGSKARARPRTAPSGAT